MSQPVEVKPDDAFGLLRSFVRHVAFVRLALGSVVHDLERRALVHDLTKMLDDEFAGFSRINAHARIHKFGSPEYKQGLAQERETIDRHFARNSHHPENSLQTFLDIIEMVCDWWGASKGYDDPRSWEDTVKLNLEYKGKRLSAEQLWLVHEVAAFLSKENPSRTAFEPGIGSQTHGWGRMEDASIRARKILAAPQREEGET